MSVTDAESAESKLRAGRWNETGGEIDDDVDAAEAADDPPSGRPPAGCCGLLFVVPCWFCWSGTPVVAKVTAVPAPEAAGDASNDPADEPNESGELGAVVVCR